MVRVGGGYCVDCGVVRRTPTYRALTLPGVRRTPRKCSWFGIKRANGQGAAPGGSINYLGSKFQSFGISSCGDVKLTFASWNQILLWLRTLDTFRPDA